MKTKNDLNPHAYSAPSIERMDVAIEQGFVGSDGKAGGDLESENPDDHHYFDYSW